MPISIPRIIMKDKWIWLIIYMEINIAHKSFKISSHDCFKSEEF